MSACNVNGCGCSSAPLTLIEPPPVGPGTAQYRIDNMDCPTEEALIRNKLEPLAGVTGLDFNLMQRTLTVSHRLDTLAPVEAALRTIGMQVQRIDTPDAVAPTEPLPKTTWWPMALAGVTATLAEVVYWITHKSVI